MSDTMARSKPAVSDNRDDRKTAHLIDGFLKPFPGSRISNSFNFSRWIMRSADMRQGGGSAESMNLENPDQVAFFFLDGEVHKRRRASVAAYFTPKAILTRYYPTMEKTMDRVVAEFRKKGSGIVDEMSLALASDVTWQIVGLTNSDTKGLTRRVKNFMSVTNSFNKDPFYRFVHDKLLGWYHNLERAYWTNQVLKKDVAPAVAEREKAPKDDILSYMLKENFSRKAMFMETTTYATAGVSTTREFIVMCVWQLSDHPDLREEFLAADEIGQFAIIEEILRLDPVAGYLYRKSAEDIPEGDFGPVKKGELFAISIRGSNQDAESVGPSPHALDPARAKRQKIVGAFMSFGDGPHRCPGSQVALHETRYFLNRVLRIPGFKLEKPPTVGWSFATQGYELRGAVVTCDRA